MNNYTIKKENDLYFLKNNGKQLICPFRGPVPVPGVANSINYVDLPCCSNCPHFYIDEGTRDDNYHVTVTCSGSSIVLPAKEESKLTTLRP